MRCTMPPSNVNSIGHIAHSVEPNSRKRTQILMENFAMLSKSLMQNTKSKNDGVGLNVAARRSLFGWVSVSACRCVCVCLRFHWYFRFHRFWFHLVCVSFAYSNSQENCARVETRIVFILLTRVLWFALLRFVFPTIFSRLYLSFVRSVSSVLFIILFHFIYSAFLSPPRTSCP